MLVSSSGVMKKGTKFYQFFALHALHQFLKEMDGFPLAEVKRFLDGCNDVCLHPIRKAAVD